ncbi:MAG TPA: LacI family DNA-binding transcriptional regulator [Baekduia sp.]|nr:LacI family DNA-binding transcriptional regulator [Baekduia sp.]
MSNRLRNRYRHGEASDPLDEPVGPSRARRVRLEDVARRAQVSPSTASRALNGRGQLAAETRAAVIEAAEALDFRPSPFARSLRTRRSSMVGLVVPDAGHPFYSALLRGAQSVLDEVGYRVTLLEAGPDGARGERAMDTLLDHHAEGMLAATAGPWAQRLVGPGAEMPVVFVDDVPDDVDAPGILAENAAGMRALVDHLVGHGHRRIGLLAGPDRTGRERLEGFRAAVAAHGGSGVEGTVRSCAWSMAAGFREGRALLDCAPRPTAVVASSAELALGFLAASRVAGIAVPDGVALASFDDPYFAPLLQPALTAVGYDATAMGARAAHMLVDAIDGVDLARSPERVAVSLTARSSCGCEHDLEADLLEVAGE